MPTTLDQARTALRASGALTLPGRRSPGSKILSVQLWVLIVLTGGLAVGSVVMIIVAYANGIFVNPLGFGVPLMAGGMCLAAWRARLWHKSYADKELLPVVFAPRGFIIAGIGPIPWHDVAPIQQSESGETLMLSQSGLHNVSALTVTQRRLLRTTGGNLLNGWRGRAIAPPSVKDMSRAESMRLFATAHRMFWRQPQQVHASQHQQHPAQQQQHQQHPAQPRQGPHA